MPNPAHEQHRLADVDEPVRRFVQAMSLPAYVWTPVRGTLRLSGFNAAAHRYTDGRIEHLVGRSATELYAERPEILDGFARCTEHREPIHADLTFRYASLNREERARVIYVPLRSGTVVVLVDPTFPEDARLLHAVARNLPTGMAYRCLNDADWTMKAVTRGCQDLTGYPPDALLDNRSVAFVDLIHEDDRASVADWVGAAVTEGRPYTVTYRLRRGDGSVRWVWEQGTLVDEGPPGVLEGLILDITEWKAWEEQAGHLQRVESLGRVTASIAHDFNNVLSVILGNVELALADLQREPSELREDLRAVERAARSGASLVKRLGAFSRSAPLRFEATDLKAEVGEIAKLLRRLLPANVALALTLDDDVPRARVDRQSLEQILLNLATNARDAMPDGGQLGIRLSRAALDEAYVQDHAWVIPGWYACLTVSDTGAGMAREVRDRVFDPFFTTKPAGQGMGLGLASVFGLVKQHGGYVHVYSEVDAGTAFRIYLPFAEHEAPRPRRASLSRDLPRGKGETVLLVEDDPELRDTSARVLERLGYRVAAVGSAEEALAALDQHAAQIACVVTDYMLPDRTGAELVHTIRTRPFAEMPCVLMTGYSPEKVAESAELEGDVRLVFKPWTVDELAEALRAALERA